ncbi:MAG: 16S rRNA (guanine(966)-N(2))-methyltransferase RsmD [Chloroflexi bacterium]|nr:16S rRNA (guanine(966)-N(2))-methyltransferase RsmD [Chloroflexota bacterium]
MAATTPAGRVVAGTARGMRLVGPAEGVRPLGDRLKEGLFAILEPAIRDGRFLDLFAGSGAGGIEALSRGARHAMFVDRDARAVVAIRRNLETTRLAGPAATVEQADALEWLARTRVGQVADDAVLVDPPYDRPELLLAVLERVAAAGPPPSRGAILAERGTLVAKHPVRTELPAEIGLLRSARERRFGDSALTLYRWSTEEAG